MDEAYLRDFFLGKITSDKLAENICRSVSHPDKKTSIVHIRDMTSTFAITREMLVKICDAVTGGSLAAQELEAIGFALIASDHFEWNDDDVLARTLSDWSCPQINYPLNVENIERCKRWLLGEEEYPQKLGPAKAGGDIISITKKERLTD